MKNLKILRHSKGYTQAQLAQFLQVGNSTIFRWEAGLSTPTLYQFLKICNILKCTPEQLCDNIAENCIPIFNLRDKNITPAPINANLSENNCSFGIVICEELSPRISCGDICYFSTNTDNNNSILVFASEDNYSGNLYLTENVPENSDIIAVCRLMHRSI